MIDHTLQSRQEDAVDVGFVNALRNLPAHQALKGIPVLQFVGVGGECVATGIEPDAIWEIDFRTPTELGEFVGNGIPRPCVPIFRAEDKKIVVFCVEHTPKRFESFWPEWHIARNVSFWAVEPYAEFWYFDRRAWQIRTVAGPEAAIESQENHRTDLRAGITIESLEHWDSQQPVFALATSIAGSALLECFAKLDWLPDPAELQGHIEHRRYTATFPIKGMDAIPGMKVASIGRDIFGTNLIPCTPEQLNPADPKVAEADQRRPEVVKPSGANAACIAVAFLLAQAAVCNIFDSDAANRLAGNARGAASVQVVSDGVVSGQGLIARAREVVQVAINPLLESPIGAGLRWEPLNWFDLSDSVLSIHPDPCFSSQPSIHGRVSINENARIIRKNQGGGSVAQWQSRGLINPKPYLKNAVGVSKTAINAPAIPAQDANKSNKSSQLDYSCGRAA